ncbi:hypothetical protein BaRGS_00000811 [Batillaria attramentaria]|uniref:Amino acid transporter transmembrane domain-containing protein n=1 Tax=Batillaria attramentaria TaxID=370345 RepID=A0ABD0M8Y7_9CAEN
MFDSPPARLSPWKSLIKSSIDLIVTLHFDVSDDVGRSEFCAIRLVISGYSHKTSVYWRNCQQQLERRPRLGKMSDDIVIEMVNDHQRSLGVHIYISDFANILKAFIGSNFLSIPFGLKQCGMALGLVSLIIIAAFTTHCCLLLVKCRYYAIGHVCELYRNMGTASPSYESTGTEAPQRVQDVSSYRASLTFDHLVSSEVLERKLKNTEEDLQSLKKQLLKTIQYGDIARMCFGWWGVAVVNTAIMVTQVGFTANYVIFTANTLYSFFPVYNCTAVTRGNKTVLLSPDCGYLTRSPWDHSQVLQDSFDSNASSPVSHFESLSESPYHSNQSSLPETLSNNSTSSSVDEVSSSLLLGAVMSLPATSNSSVWSEVWTNAPDLRLLVIVPVVVFMVLVLPRSIRGLGIISAVGNVGIMSGALLVLLALAAQFEVSDTWQWARVEGLPIFFGTVAGAFEGAGMILPVEGSMDGNHHNFPYLLAGCITLVVLILEGVCVLSYLTFGDTIAQMVTMNITAGSGMSVAVNICLMVGVICTFPIMAYPVVSLAELALFGSGGLCNSKSDESTEEEKTSLLPATKQNEISPWKRNVIGITLVLILGGLGVLLKDSFAYITAFIGALGSTLVAYILPCMFHLRLCWPRLSPLIKIKDMCIIVAGMVFMVTGVYSVISDMIS